MIDEYFSERDGAQRPRDEEELGVKFWGGFVALVERLVGDGSFAETFPLTCPDTNYPTGCDFHALGRAFQAEHPDIQWPLLSSDLPGTLPILDAVEFFALHVSKATERHPHHSRSWGRIHDHITNFNREAGQTDYIDTVNRLFRRNENTYEVDREGHIRRLGPPILQETLLGCRFETGDQELDRLLETARQKFTNPSLEVRKEALEKLWDAWERLKTVFPGKDKKAQVQALLRSAVPENELCAKIDIEARALTDIGNEFMIRHTEVGKTPIERPEHVDYLFHRLFSLVWMLLRATRKPGI